MPLAQKDIDDLCLSIYHETRDSSPIGKLCRSDPERFGFEILMGPPFKNAPIAFIGFQPGNWECSVSQARELGYEKDWVSPECHYHTREWELAKRMRKMFGSRLSGCVGFNAIFVRAPNIAEYNKAIPRVIRREVKNYCAKQLIRMIDAINPQQLVVIGYSTMDSIGRSERELHEGGKSLLRQGLAFGRSAFVTPHISAAWGYTDADRKRMGEIILGESAEPASWMPKAM